MPGSVRQRQPGVWELRVYVGRDAGGRVRHQHATFRGTKKAAEWALAPHGGRRGPPAAGAGRLGRASLGAVDDGQPSSVDRNGKWVLFFGLEPRQPGDVLIDELENGPGPPAH